jgi:rRNA pseudouridine-1189 N-methylase Emg1 (Nep1/Mra1 family)
VIPPPTPQERKRANAELEQRIRAAGENYERYLLADAYAHAAMRRRTREDARRAAAVKELKR